MKSSKRDTILFLENIRSTHNVGSLFRIADTVGITRMILAGITPTPLDRFGRARKDIAKTALGAELSLSWEHTDDPLATLTKLHAVGYKIVALEQDDRAIEYKKYNPSAKSVLVVGNEITGVSKEVLDLATTIIEIPLRGKKESLNVSIAAAVALFRILNV